MWGILDWKQQTYKQTLKLNILQHHIHIESWFKVEDTQKFVQDCWTTDDGAKDRASADADQKTFSGLR